MILFFIFFISDTVFGNCNQVPRNILGIWIAGQRIDMSGNVPFLWKPDNDTWKKMSYTNWDGYEPNFAYSREFCVHFTSYIGYTWNDFDCNADASYSGVSGSMCVLCEIDMD